MGRTLRGILFDKDGTLIDFDRTWGPAAHAVMTTLSGGDRARFDALVRVSHFVVAEQRFLPTSPLLAGASSVYGPLWAAALDRPAGPDLYGEMDRLFREAALRTLHPIGAPAGLAAALRAADYTLGIATNDAEASARAQAEVLGLTRHLDFVAGYDSGHGAKPGPGMVLAFAEHLGVAPHRIALVGDTVADTRAARAAGAVAVAVLSGPLGEGARETMEREADHVIGSIHDLPELLATIDSA